MKKIITFVLGLAILFSLVACGEIEAESGFFSDSVLVECKLSGMPVPSVDEMWLDGNTVYCYMTTEERVRYAGELAAFLIAKDDIYYKGYYYETGNPGGIFFIPEYRFAPLTPDADFGGWFAFSLTETLNDGDEFNYSYWNGVSLSVYMEDGTIGSFSYNTAIEIKKDPSGFVYLDPDYFE